MQSLLDNERGTDAREELGGGAGADLTASGGAAHGAHDRFEPGFKQSVDDGGDEVGVLVALDDQIEDEVVQVPVA